MKMYERLIPEHQHALNEFCRANDLSPEYLSSESVTHNSAYMRMQFYAYCESIGLAPKEMAEAVNRTNQAVYKTMRKKEFWNLVRQYE